MNRKSSNKRNFVNQVKIEFTGKSLTAYGGMVTLLAKCLQTIGFKEWVESSIPVEEKSNNSLGIYPKVLSLFLTVLAGGDRFAHLLWINHGADVLQKVFAVDHLPKASTTLTRFWNKINSFSLSEFFGNNARKFASDIVKYAGITEDNLNFDSTVVTRYGEQEGAKKGNNPNKRGRLSHNPILAYLSSGYIVNMHNRSGNTFSGNGASEFFKNSIAHIGKVMKIKRVLCDSGFYLIDFIDHLESGQYKYIIAARMYHGLQTKITEISEWEKIDDGIESGEFLYEHTDEKWDKPRRYVVIRQEKKIRPTATGRELTLPLDFEEYKEYRYTVMITNDNAPCEEIWRAYRQRANDENVNKEIKDGYGFASFNMKSFWATEAVMTVNTLVFHNLIHLLNQTIFNPKGPNENLQTIRGKYFIIPGIMGHTGRYLVLRLGIADKHLRGKIEYMLVQIGNMKLKLNCNAVEI